MRVTKKHPKLRFVGITCPRVNFVRKTFASYAEGGIPERWMDDIEGHILECDPCRKAFLDFTADLFGKRRPSYTNFASPASTSKGSSNFTSMQSTPSEKSGEADTTEADFLATISRPSGQNRTNCLRLHWTKAA